MLLALEEAGIRPDFIVGTSVGAVNGAWIAGRTDPDGVTDLAQLWRGLTRENVFRARPLLGLMGFLGRRRNLDVERYEPIVDLRVVPPLCPIRTSPSDFSHAAKLIDRAHTTTAEWLTARPPATGQSYLFAPHHH